MRVIEYKSAFAEQVKDLLVELQIHLANLDDRKVIVLNDSYREGYFNYLLEEMERHDGKIFLAEQDNKIVGVIACKIFQEGNEEERLTSICPKIGFISDLCVTESMRRKGIATELLRAAEDYFEGKSCDYTQLQVFAPNVNAAKFYKDYGFGAVSINLSKKTGGKK